MADQMMEKINSLKFMTRVSGVLHEIQVKNLCNWFFLFLDTDKVELNFDFENKTVEYTITKKLKKNLQNKELRFQTLDKSVKFLLGDDFGILVKYKDKVLFDSVQRSIDALLKKLSPGMA